MKIILQNIAKKLLFKKLTKIDYGCIKIVDQDVIYSFGNNKEIIGIIIINNRDFYFNVLFGGSIGASDSFINGAWKSPNLTNIIRLMAINSHITNNIESLYNILIRPFFNISHYLKRNNKKNSKKNISKHYDLNNTFFSQFLDSRMMYSSAIYRNTQDNLELAAKNKLRIICKKLQLKKTDHVLEIGSGWGGFAIYAATHFNCKVTTTTISKQQFLYTSNKVKKLKLQKKIKVIFKDYRDLKGTFDKLVSIEMIEAVGHKYYDQYFNKINLLLKKDGLALIQAITIRDQNYYAALNSVDFIQKYIFPGSCIPSLTILLNSITTSSNMITKDIEDIGNHYARTLKHWRFKFNKNKQVIKNIGFDDAFIRMWIYYFSYCEGGFKEKVINNHQILLAKPMFRD
ncbi:cyclopropane-fatty-acyl-phospholipid synthase family protein [Nitrosomonadales bacterium]|nr:cyclopropane-fatty-acyl-phospholipid synthase family protein [Nitrosomonadales bacterium]